jgi:hypothetical protein
MMHIKDRSELSLAGKEKTLVGSIETKQNIGKN